MEVPWDAGWADKRQATLMRNYITPNERAPKLQSYKFRQGTTAVLDEKVTPTSELRKLVTVIDLDAKPVGGDAMEVDA